MRIFILQLLWSCLELMAVIHFWLISVNSNWSKAAVPFQAPYEFNKRPADKYFPSERSKGKLYGRDNTMEDVFNNYSKTKVKKRSKRQGYNSWSVYFSLFTLILEIRLFDNDGSDGTTFGKHAHYKRPLL